MLIEEYYEMISIGSLSFRIFTKKLEYYIFWLYTFWNNFMMWLPILSGNIPNDLNPIENYPK